MIDVQNDFTEGGPLAIDGGGAVARAISAWLDGEGDGYDLVVSSRDWHDADNDNGGHFATVEPPNYNTTWPVHCVAGTPGAEYHSDYLTDSVDVHIYKGQGAPSYSAFQGTTHDGQTLPDVLRTNNITDLDVAGLATDFCVKASALDALALGLNVRILTDLVAGVAPQSAAESLDELMAAGAQLL